MRIVEFVWPQSQIDHILKHGIEPHEFEEVCSGKPFIRRVKSEGKNPVYNIMSQTKAGRYLLCVVICFPDGKGYPVTARPMTRNEKRRYRKWRDR